MGIWLMTSYLGRNASPEEREEHMSRPPLVLRLGLSVEGDDRGTFLTLPMIVEQGPIVVRDRAARCPITLAEAREIVRLLERKGARR